MHLLCCGSTLPKVKFGRPHSKRRPKGRLPDPPSDDESDRAHPAKTKKPAKHASWIPFLNAAQNRTLTPPVDAFAPTYSEKEAVRLGYQTHSYDRPLILNFAGRRFKAVTPLLYAGETCAVWTALEDRQSRGETCNRQCAVKIVYTHKLVERNTQDRENKPWGAADRMAALAEVQKEVDVMRDNPGLSPFLAELIFVGHDLDATYIFMPTYSVNLRKIFANSSRAKLTVEKLARCAVEVLLGLNDLHERNIAHLNLTPDNICFHGTRQHARICDFGACQHLDAVYPPYVARNPYMAPELRKEKARVDGIKADIYSFGVLFLEMMDFEWIEGHWMNKPGPNEALNFRFDKMPFDAKDPQVEEFSKAYYAKWDLYSLVYGKLLAHDPQQRPTIDKILNHKFFRDHGCSDKSKLYEVATKDAKEFNAIAGHLMLNHENLSQEVLASAEHSGECVHLMPGRHVDAARARNSENTSMSAISTAGTMGSR
ncbi:kinase-like protein [Cylindrobasidium torrendii FP15055 ss-10]|uniref:Kinase-like protein n=1 Tax=Cylindrobasidium torrendii FP15055 ss-10 TaxID=1314674 RepID=A0A0D7BL96_9AGAR|nr:kinase-like protein [Cylindrobasidium torrendii FP15055 ss-10]